MGLNNRISGPIDVLVLASTTKAHKKFVWQDLKPKKMIPLGT